MAKKPSTTKRITQEELKEIYLQQEEARGLQTQAEAQRAKLIKAGNELVQTIQKQRAEVEDGAFKPNITRVIRRVPHYKQETMDLAARLGLDPETHLEECRNRGGRVTYFRLKMKIVE